MINDGLSEHLGKSTRPLDARTLRRILREELKRTGSMWKVNKHRLLATVILTASLGCTNSSGPTRTPETRAASGHGYAMLYEILGQERQVSKLLLINREPEALETVIGAIAQTCGKAYDRLGDFAKADPGLDLIDTGLPIEEVRTRAAIAATKREQLLAASGEELELQLLLAQNEALTYMAHLADTLSRNEPDPARLAFLRELWKDLTRLQEDVLALVRHPAGVHRP